MTDRPKIILPKGSPLNEVFAALGLTKSEEVVLECYTAFNDKGEMLRFNVTELNDFCKQGGSTIKDIQFAKEMAQHMRASGRIEQYRIDRLTEKDMEKLPIICFFYDGKYLLVDGAHRVVKQLEAGAKTVQCHCLTQDIWIDFLLPISEEERNMTEEEFMKQDSGFKRLNPFKE